MKNYIIYNKQGKILKSGCCSDSLFYLQAGNGEFVIEGIANDITQKIIDGKIVDKTPEEIEAEKPPKPEPVPYEQQRANITNEQWQDILDRVVNLEETN